MILVPSKNMRVLGDPKAQPRPRATTRGGKFARVYNPSTATAWKKLLVAASNADRLGDKPFAGSVNLRLTFVLRRPKKPKQVHAIGKPDVDNLAKAVMDALSTAGWWNDDAQVTMLVVTKQYTEGTGFYKDPGVFINAWEDV